MWHVCEECLAEGKPWEEPLLNYARTLAQQYRHQQNEVEKWYQVCKVQFPIYVDYWAKHKHTITREPLAQEMQFKVPYQLPSGRVVFLRGKWDSVDIVKKKYIYLQENKSKSEIDEPALRNQLQFDMQTMMYLVALYKLFEYSEEGTTLDTEEMLPAAEEWGNVVYPANHVIAGVRYNVICRPLSGGKGSIRPHKARGTKNITPAETMEAFYNRLAGVIRDECFDAKGKPLQTSSFFARFDCQVSSEDVQRFEQRFLIPILEQLCDWWAFMEECYYLPWNSNQKIHWQHPYGVYNVLNEGGRSDLDECLMNGSEVGLQRVKNLFPELNPIGE